MNSKLRTDVETKKECRAEAVALAESAVASNESNESCSTSTEADSSWGDEQENLSNVTENLNNSAELKSKHPDVDGSSIKGSHVTGKCGESSIAASEVTEKFGPPHSTSIEESRIVRSPHADRLHTRKPLVAGLLVSLMLVLVAITGNRIAWNKYTNSGIAEAKSHNYKSAEKFLVRALNESRKFANTDSRVATSLSNLGELYRLQGEFEKDEVLQLKAWQIRERLFGDKHPDVASSLINIGMLLEQKEEPLKADRFYRRALAIRESCQGADHKDVAAALVLIAGMCDRDNREEAERLYERALQIQLKADVLDIKQFAAIREKLSSLYYDQQYKRLLVEQRILSILDNSATAGREPEIASALLRVANFTTAGCTSVSTRETLYERAADVWEKYFVPGNPNYDSAFDETFVEWANLYGFTKQPGGYSWRRGNRWGYSGGQAVAVFRRELAILNSLPEQEHAVAVVLNNLSRCTALPRAERERLCRQSIQIWKKVIAQHPEMWVGSTHNISVSWHIDENIADSFESLVQLAGPEKAMSIRNEEIAMWEKVLGPASPKIAAVLLSIVEDQEGPVITEPGLEQNTKIFEKAADIWERFLLATPPTPDNLDLLDSADYLFQRWALHENQTVRARRRQLALCEKFAGPNDIHVARVLHDLAKIETLPDSEREKFCKRAVEIWRRNLPFIGPPDYKFSTWDVSDLFEILASLYHGKRALSVYNLEMSFWENRCDEETVSVLNRWAELNSLPIEVRKKIFARAAATWEKYLASPFRSGGYGVSETFSHWADLDETRAESIYRQQLSMWERVRGVDHPEVAKALNRLATVSTVSEIEKARCLSRSASIWLNCVNTTGSSRWERFETDIDETFSLWSAVDNGRYGFLAAKKEVELWKQTGDKSARKLAGALTKLALMTATSPFERVELLKKSVAIWEKQTHIEQSDVKYADLTFQTLSAIYRARGQQSQALSLSSRALALWQRNSPLDSAQVAGGLNVLAFSIEQKYCESRQRLPLSENLHCRHLYEHALRIWKSVAGDQLALGADSEYTAGVEFTLLRLAALSKPVAAERFYKKVVVIEARDLGNDYLSAVYRLGVHYCRNGQYPKAAALYRTIAANSTFHQDLRRNAQKLLTLQSLQQAVNTRSPQKGKSANMAPYLSALSWQFEQTWCPPYETGDPVVRFFIDKQGNARDLRLSKSSGSFALDQSAILAVEVASPFMPLPAAGPDFADIEFFFEAKKKE